MIALHPEVAVAPALITSFRLHAIALPPVSWVGARWIVRSGRVPSRASAFGSRIEPRVGTEAVVFVSNIAHFVREG
jgi:hypothetical protein